MQPGFHYLCPLQKKAIFLARALIKAVLSFINVLANKGKQKTVSQPIFHDNKD